RLPGRNGLGVVDVEVRPDDEVGHPAHVGDTRLWLENVAEVLPGLAVVRGIGESNGVGVTKIRARGLEGGAPALGMNEGEEVPTIVDLIDAIEPERAGH